jgi:CubicO group peptidase (beta-lactamase class C family)
LNSLLFSIWFIVLIINCGESNGSKNNIKANYCPTERWRTSTPEQQGMDSRQLVNAFNFIQKNKLNIHIMSIIRNGYAVVKAYFYPYTHGTVHNIASVTKSITSALVGIALDKGYIKDAKKPFMDYFLDRSVANLDVNKENVTIENLLTMSTGFCRDFHEREHSLAE